MNFLYILDFYYSFYNYPLFYLFFILFFLTTFCSFLCISYLGLYGVFVLNFIPLFIAWVTLLFYFKIIFQYNFIYYINAGSWILLNNYFKNNFDFIVDTTSYSFTLLTTSIAVFVYIYAFSYFRYEPLVERLLLFLNSFILSMIFLVNSGNTVMFFLGWELIGLTSFFLINFWSTKVATLKCAFKAYSFNKLSDFFLLIAILLIFSLFNTTDFFVISSSAYLFISYETEIIVFKLYYFELIGFFLLAAAFIKSAQFGAHIWLPDSMEAPVPASALIHSATLVSAGIFILLRYSVFFENSKLLLSVIFIVGSFTAFYGGIVAAFQTDCKKLLAYSTISHCGFLMVLYSTLCFEYVVLYLYVHGFFKASTFLSVGNILRFSRLQDYRRMGNFSKYLPFDCYATFVGLINLAGLPFSLGFYIKHLLFVSLNINLFLYYLCLSFCLIGAFSGIFYSYKLYYYVFFDFKKGRKPTYLHVTPISLNSNFYTNSGIASTIAIFFLIVIAYIIPFLLLFVYTSNYSYYSDFSSYKLYNTQYEYMTELLQSTRLYQLVNYIVILLLTVVIYTPWRSSHLRHSSLSSLLVFFFFIFLCILSLFLIDNNIHINTINIIFSLNYINIKLDLYFSYIVYFISFFNIKLFNYSLYNIYIILLCIFSSYIVKYLLVFTLIFYYLKLWRIYLYFIIICVLLLITDPFCIILNYYSSSLELLILFLLVCHSMHIYSLNNKSPIYLPYNVKLIFLSIYNHFKLYIK